MKKISTEDLEPFLDHILISLQNIHKDLKELIAWLKEAQFVAIEHR